MKKDQIFPKPLLLSQEETAILLGIHRSQWAMYEINQRSLPTDATIRLAELLAFVLEKPQTLILWFFYVYSLFAMPFSTSTKPTLNI